MSKHETPMVLRYWQEVGGTLIEEFLAVPKSPTCGKRLVDAVILPALEKRRVPQQERRRIPLEGQDVIVIQAKAARLGMYLAGQALFSAELMKRFQPRSIRSIALCAEDDSVLRPIVENHGVEVVVDRHARRPLYSEPDEGQP